MSHSRSRPKLGQHFLGSSEFCVRIAESLPINSSDLVIEIGPGRGAITRLLLQRCRCLTVVEIDPALAAALRTEFMGNPQVEVLEADVLKTSLNAICRRHEAESCYVFGNLPYYITSPIVFHLFAARDHIRRMTLLMQLEAAQRVTAQPGSRDFGFFSVYVQCHSAPEILFEVPPGAFNPPPKVYSALVDFRMRSRFPAWDEMAFKNFLCFAQRCFRQKRKNLLNNLAEAYPRDRIRSAIDALGISPSVRAEQLTIEELAAIFNVLK